MTEHEAPPGAIIPPRIGPIGLDLPDGWWLVGDGVLEDGDTWDVDCLVVRRRMVQVTVEARPGDRVIVISGDLWEAALDDLDVDPDHDVVDSGPYRLFDAFTNAVVAE